ncbi:MAG: hypothetical protein Q9164_002133, partial [Protoblastenia rupestris]
MDLCIEPDHRPCPYLSQGQTCPSQLALQTNPRPGALDYVYEAGAEPYLVANGLNNAYPNFFEPTPPQRKPLLFLDLPGEIRNIIYRFTLISAKAISIKLRFEVGYTNLLCANKQIFNEAREIFHHENIFQIPESLFVGAAILDQFDTLYRVPRTTLMTMRILSVQVP